MDSSRRDKLFALAAKEGKQASLDATPMEILGIGGGGRPVPALQLSAIDGKTKADFNRVQNRKDEFVFFYDEDKDNPNSPSLAFRAGANFKLIAAIEYRNGKWAKIPQSRAATLFAQQIALWARTVEGATSIAQTPSSSIFPAPQPAPPRTTEPPAAPIASSRTPAALSSQGQGMNRARQEKLLALLAVGGKETSLDAIAVELLGIKSAGRPLPVMQVSAIDGKTKADFNRVQNRKDEYVFSYDEDKDNPQSPSMAFRAGANFKLIAAIEYSNGRWAKIPPARAATLFAQQIETWVYTVDAN